MDNIKLFPWQEEALTKTEGQDRVAYYHPMGSGKTFTGSEKMHELKNRVNVICCQRSKIDDWVEHMKTYYPDMTTYDLTKPAQYKKFIHDSLPGQAAKAGRVVGVINYDLIWRRSELKELWGATLMLDESSLLQNFKAKRTKFILNMKADAVILLSGTPVGGRYERLLPQLRLLGWKIPYNDYWDKYIDYHIEYYGGLNPIKEVDGYKNVEDLKQQMREHGAHLLTEDQLFELPAQNDQTVYIKPTADYKRFLRDRVVIVKQADGSEIELIGDMALNALLYSRQLCGQYNKDKLAAVKDLLDSADGSRFLIFYNFNAELEALTDICRQCNRPVSVVNGQQRDLAAYETEEDSVTLIQYQAGAMGLNLQKATRTIYFTPPLSSELYEQSRKRTHRLGQERPCYYYHLTVRDSVEEHIYETLAERMDYTAALFEPVMPAKTA